MKIDLAYGKGVLPVEIEDRRVAAVLRKPEMPAIADPAQAIRESIVNPIGARPLRELCAPGKTACLVVSDITRPTPNPRILSVLLDHLQENHIRREDITILIATGMHRPCEGIEADELLGADIVSNCRVVNHCPGDCSSLKALGKTSKGTPVEVSRVYMDADIKILTGLIEPHFMAGYSGGRKSICPGISGLSSLTYSHGVECLSHPKATTCILDGNPFHEEALEAARIAGADFIVNVVIDDKRRLAGVFSGDLVKAHLAGCAFVDRYFKVKVDEPQDVVLTTNAGYPLDLNFYQTVKGLYAALPAVRPGGTIVMASRCHEGMGSAGFVELLRELSAAKSRAAFLDAHRDNFVMDQWEVHKLIQVLDKAKFMIYSEGMDESDARLGQGMKVDSVEAGLARAMERDFRVIVIPEGPYVVPFV